MASRPHHGERGAPQLDPEVDAVEGVGGIELVGDTPTHRGHQQRQEKGKANNWGKHQAATMVPEEKECREDDSQPRATREAEQQRGQRAEEEDD